MRAFALLGLVLLAVVIVLWGAIVRTGLPKGPVTDAELDGLAVPDDPDVRALLERWRDRARRWRMLGGLPLATGVAVASVALRSEIRIGVGGAPLWSDPLVMGLLGAFAGAIGAELHQLRQRQAGPRTVSLAPRDLDDYRPEGSGRRTLVLAGVAAGVAMVHLGVPAASGPPIPGLLGVVVAGTVLTVQRAIVGRPRPALTGHLAAADDAVRRLAIRSVDAAGAGSLLLLTLWQVSAITEALVPGDSGLAAIAALTYLGFTILALIWWRRGGPATVLARAAEERRGVAVR